MVKDYKQNKRGKDRGEHFTKMLRLTMQTAAWRELSSTAQALYPWIKLEWKGPNTNNNGKLRLSVRQAAKCLGCSHMTAARAFQDLQAKGFIYQTEGASLGISGQAKSPAFEVTEIALPTARDGRHLYRDWQLGHDFPVKRSASNNPKGTNGKQGRKAENVMSLQEAMP